MRKQRGWTLMETLTALAIFVIIAAILYPVFAKLWSEDLGLAAAIDVCVAAGITALVVTILRRSDRGQ